ncbi:hypothetical protein O181_034042 [Austropuccinia psidii MF-1]|uniref:Uncharacterized protein n=1 Tax=Austropuccinia psidii MF-1 TaxID=1389203 RepID=A0A9Q3D5U6_9BASI|nr:hypothetical protein [Austropuccinia psidii MF-1]
MPTYTIENTLTRRKLSQAVVPVISTCRGITGSGIYHFPPAHNRPNATVPFKRARMMRDTQQSAYCIPTPAIFHTVVFETHSMGISIYQIE